ncbi:MAG: 50S ribosomal protein L7/L12 [Chloroflexi bacterium]|uniref:Large ribosomal subunit protein bL12 n=1 Tax=Candidatus Chlorohelix allophototropha TaxID=3003348 RepID=A0A8T7M937_9CHLR|nr:50S ribosomal protein L7/L12 [Chloroflexota bacterium]WJW68395.1 50S ribosomal protein L7/L12 [Chloroflexota bacterium L227-S17]
MATVNEIVELIAQLNILEVSELVKQLEDKFGVTAAAPVQFAAAPAAAAAAPVEAAPVEVKTEFDLVLTDIGAEKIKVIKVVRDLRSDLGLKEAKELVEAAPKAVLEAVTKEAAEAGKAKLVEVGAKADVK